MSHRRYSEIEPGVIRADWWHALDDGRLQCDLCPRCCRLHDGQRGFCFVREARGGELRLTSYGLATGYCIDPIEKKPLNHFYPGTSVLSFGTAGCNLGCRFCQNWETSKARETRVLSSKGAPERVARAAAETGCRSIAFTYNDPVVFAEYAIDCALEARAAGLATVAVSSGYIASEARRAFYEHIDAANIDLKAFTERFYDKICFAHLAPVLDTLEWIRHETGVWLEVTTLLIPGQNDSEHEVAALCEWVAGHLGSEVPLHFTAFHPDFRMLDVPPTPAATLRRARAQAKAEGIAHAYTGNIRDEEGQSTYCTACGRLLIGRDGYTITAWALDAEGRCVCGQRLAGRYAPDPGRWGSYRLPLSVS